MEQPCLGALTQPVTGRALSVIRTDRLQVGGMMAWGQVDSLYQEKLVRYFCASSNCPAIPPQWLLIARASLLEVIATLCHLIVWLTQFDIEDSPIFHTNGSPRSLPSHAWHTNLPSFLNGIYPFCGNKWSQLPGRDQTATCCSLSFVFVLPSFW